MKYLVLEYNSYIKYLPNLLKTHQTNLDLRIIVFIHVIVIHLGQTNLRQIAERSNSHLNEYQRFYFEG